MIHFIHRLMAVIISLGVIALVVKAVRCCKDNPKIVRGAWALLAFVAVQFTLGVLAVFSYKEPTLTSIHVVVGAATLGMSALLSLRALPVSLRKAETAEARKTFEPVSAS